MKRISFGNRLTPFLLIGCVVLAAVLVFEWRALSRQSDIAGGKAARPVSGTELELDRTPYRAPDFAAFAEILERPLFTEGRTPPPAVEQVTAKAGKPAKLAMRLEGIALTPGARIAVVRDIANNKLLRLAEGAKHQGWLVERVNATSATLRRGEQTQELKLELNNSMPKSMPNQVLKKLIKKKK